MTVLQQARENEEYIIGLRREFHAEPELSLKEFHTADRIEEELEKMGISHWRCRETGVYAVLKGTGEGGGTIALRADTDALSIEETHKTEYCSRRPGVMHACGHDAHAACLLGAARLLAQRKETFGGEVRFFFQPGEEIGAGAKEFIEEGHLEGVQRIFGLHAASDLPTGTIGIKPGSNNAAVDYFKITVHGIAAHVSTPEKGADALYIASQIVIGAQAVATRLHSPVEPMLIGIGRLDAGTAYNIVAGQAVIEGTTRTLTEQTRAEVRRQLDQLAGQTALLWGGSAQTQWVEFTPPLVNPEDVSKEVQRQAALLPGVQVITDRPVSLGGDNFAEFQKQVPGVYAYLGTRSEKKPNTALPHHNGGFDIDESALAYGTALYAQYALWWLQEGNKI